MTDTTTVDDDAAAPVDETVVDGDDVAAGDGDVGADEPLELAGGIAPEGPIKDRLLLPFLLPWLCIAAVALYALNISRIFLAGDSTVRARSSARSSPSRSWRAPRSSPPARGCARRRWR